MPSSAATQRSYISGSAFHRAEISMVSTTIPARYRRGERRHVVAMPHPALDERGVEHGGTGAFGFDDGHRGVEQALVGLVQHDEDAMVGHVEVPRRLGVVVEAQHRRRGAPAQDAPARLEPVGERRESVGAPAARAGQADAVAARRR